GGFRFFWLIAPLLTVLDPGGRIFLGTGGLSGLIDIGSGRKMYEIEVLDPGVHAYSFSFGYLVAIGVAPLHHGRSGVCFSVSRLTRSCAKFLARSLTVIGSLSCAVFA